MDKNDGIIFLRFVKGICPIYKILFLREISQSTTCEAETGAG